MSYEANQSSGKQFSCSLLKPKCSLCKEIEARNIFALAQMWVYKLRRISRGLRKNCETYPLNTQAAWDKSER